MTALWNSFKIAFSMYSKIPVPQSEWTKENMRYVMCFLPIIGAVIGGLVYGWALLASVLGIVGKTSFYTAVMILIPVAVTGGIHLDGFLDTSDALSSWQTQEKRLEILKDSRAGAFAVLMGCCYFVLDFGVYSALDNRWLLQITCVNFVLSRALSGFAIVTFKMAKNTGLAATFSDGAQKKTVAVWMCDYMVVAAILMLWIHPVYGAVALVVAGLGFLYYRHMAYKNFGGITGDLAGWFLQVCELLVPFVLVLASYIIGF